MAKQIDIEKWRIEISLAEEFRKKEFGEYTKDEITKAGENIEYFERGFTYGHLDDTVDDYTTLNLFHAVTKNIVPALYFQNPQINVVPLRREDEQAAPLAREILNHYYREIGVEDVNKKIIWDAYVLGHGIYKIGYATRYGLDVIDEKETEKKRQRTLLEKVGLVKPKDEEVVHPDLNYNIIDESPYIQYISPFDFLIDPRARTLDDAQWVAHVVRKTVDSIKSNPKYKNTKDIKGLYEPNKPSDSNIMIPDSALDSFKTVDLYEIHYRHDSKAYILVISKDTGNIYRAHYHEESPYEMDGFQFDMLSFNNHGHKLYSISDLSKIKNLQDRFTTTLDAILEQIDKFVPKIAVDSGKIGDPDFLTLKEGGIGAIVKVGGNPREIISEISFTQLKADLLATIDRIVDIVTIQTGLTKAKLLGVSSADTATGETLSHGGETLRLADMTQAVESFINKQATKLWQVIKQFANFQILQLITGEAGVDPQTGQTLFNWLQDIDGPMSERLALGQFRLKMSVGSTQRHDMASIRKQFENLINIVSNSQAVMIAQQQGKKIDIGEFLRMYLSQFPEVIRDVGKIIQDIGPQTSGLLPPEVGGQGGTTSGSGMNALRALQGQPAPSTGQEIGAGYQT
uniref:Putative head tail connector protein n=1 Tax=viral metagenome TaxID=1070528 RepID=A0A6M3KI58_9ZZZZ